MRERILKFLKAENLSSAKFADDIGVQRSSVSHILSGRNNPGFEFIQKILLKYKELSADWLILGKGEMYNTYKQSTLFDEKLQPKASIKPESQDPVASGESDIIKDLNMITNVNTTEKKENTFVKTVDRIVIFYADKTFIEYFPQKE
jgi:transcriptional regulator with XRE-family HTH domain